MRKPPRKNGWLCEQKEMVHLQWNKSFWQKGTRSKCSTLVSHQPSLQRSSVKKTPTWRASMTERLASFPEKCKSEYIKRSVL